MKCSSSKTDGEAPFVAYKSAGVEDQQSKRSKPVSGKASRVAAGGAPRVGQPGWACGHMCASPVLPLYSPWRELGVDRKRVQQMDTRHFHLAPSALCELIERCSDGFEDQKS